jgi:CotH kinase protein/Chitobiase/beta-hexosaminidase C-terminal domain
MVSSNRFPLSRLIVLSLGILCASGFLARSAAVAKNSPVQINVPAGFQNGPFSLELATPVQSATIRYTLDGTEPRLNGGFEYTKPLTIASNTILRCASFQNGIRLSPPATRTYLFMDQVLHQPPSPAGFPTGREGWQGHPSVYGMYPRIVDDPAYKERIKSGFKSLPILSIVSGVDDLFSEQRGIYVNSLQRGEEWERPCSAEFILTNGVTAFQVDCGVRIQGNSNRILSKSPKHSFRLMFKEKYGTPKLHYPIFPETRVKKFDTLVLRADYNNSWVHWNEANRARAQRVRDAWLKDSERAMGWVAGHNRYVHLFLNGLYWGIYDLAERPDAHFAAAYFGGKEEDYDVINEGQAKDGKLNGFHQLNSIGNLAQNSQYERLQKRLNLPEFMDYLLLQFYAGNQDVGEDKNWYVIGRRNPPGPFSYLVWDGEQIFHFLSDDTVNAPYENPFRLARELQANAEYRVAFGDRVQKHFFGDGALTPTAVIQRWKRRAAEVDLAMIAESARWGYCRRNPPYTHDGDYLQEQQRLLTSYFPQRTLIVLEQLRTAGLYPRVDAPVLNLSVSKSSPESTLSAKSSNGGTIYITLDNSDPREYGSGAVSPRARPYKGPMSVSTQIHAKARVLKDGSWSALTETGSARLP